MKKKVIALATAGAVALSVGAASVASAHDGLGGRGGAGLSGLLADLVSKGTITQSQADAIVKAQSDARALAEANRPTQAEMEAHRTAEIAVITSTLGVTEATLKSRLQAGESLATIAGDKKSALITALVAFETKEIDARVTAGKLTSAQATTLKANLTAMVTDKVNSVKGFGKKGRGGHGFDGPGRGGRGQDGGSNSGGSGQLVVPGTSTTNTAKYTSGLTIKA